MLNTASIMGRFTKTPELHKTESGISVTSFTIVNNVYQNEKPNYIECVAWRGTAELICHNCEKGQLVAVKGTLQTREFDNKNGERRKSTEIVVEDITFCGKAEKQENKAPVDIETSFVLEEDDLPY